MAGHANNWYKVKTGLYKGKVLYIPKARQQQLGGRAAVIDLLDFAEASTIARIIKGVPWPKGAGIPSDTRQAPQLHWAQESTLVPRGPKPTFDDLKPFTGAVAPGTERRYGNGDRAGRVERVYDRYTIMSRFGGSAGRRTGNFDVVDHTNGAVLADGLTLYEAMGWVYDKLGIDPRALETVIRAELAAARRAKQRYNYNS